MFRIVILGSLSIFSVCVLSLWLWVSHFFCGPCSHFVRFKGSVRVSHPHLIHGIRTLKTITKSLITVSRFLCCVLCLLCDVSSFCMKRAPDQPIAIVLFSNSEVQLQRKFKSHFCSIQVDCISIRRYDSTVRCQLKISLLKPHLRHLLVRSFYLETNQYSTQHCILIRVVSHRLHRIPIIL